MTAITSETLTAKGRLPRIEPLSADYRGGDSVVAGLPLGRVSSRAMRWAVLLVSLFGLTTVALLPIAEQRGQALAGFVPAYQTAVFLLYGLSFLHLVSYVRHTGAVALLHIAAGCMFSALILLIQMFSFPIWGPTQLVGSGPATTSWLWTFWHLGPTIFTFTYLVARRDRGPTAALDARAANRAIVLTGVGVLVFVAMAAAISTLALPWLPTIVLGDDYRALSTSGVGPAVLIATLASLVVLAKRTRLATQVELCLAVSLALLVMDDVLTLIGGSRLSVGWYAGRAEAALSAAILLGLFLMEINRRFARVSVRAQSLAEQQSELARTVQELDEANGALTVLARQDGLTQLANRRTLDEALALEGRRARRDHIPMTLLMIDVDKFKLYNDHYGHQAGDACLRKVARVLSEVAGRPGDVAARYGGEEFALLLATTDLHGGRVIAETLRAALLHARIPHETTPSGQVTVSIGVSSLIPLGEEGEIDQLVATADRALYRAKQSGRDRVVAVSVEDAAADEAAASAAVHDGVGVAMA